jgi:hypothetical protein
MVQDGLGAESFGFGQNSFDHTDYRSPSSASGTLANSSIHSYSSTTTLNDAHGGTDVHGNHVGHASHTSSSSSKVGRAPSMKPRKEHGRTQSKTQPEQKSVGEFALHHLFNSV